MTNRMIMIEVPGFDSSKDELVVVSFSGTERVSRLFNFHLDLVSKNLDIQPDKFIGQQVDISVGRGTEPPRFFNGFINRFSALGILPGKAAGEMYRIYRAEVVPWLWFLTQTSDCRVFNKPAEDKLKVIDIIETVLGECKHNKFSRKSMTAAQEREMEYCVQYRETDFNFVSRLMEQFGIYYYFTHEQGKHEMVLSDANGGFSTCVESKVNFAGSLGAHPKDHLTQWEHEFQFVPGKYTHTDYDFKHPSTDLRRSSGESTAKLSGHSDYEIFDYPGEYETTAEGQTEADVRIQEFEAVHNVIRGASQCRTFTAGHKFKLENHAAPSENSEYALLSVLHTAVQPGPLSPASAAFSYTNTFSCIPEARQFIPPRATPRPVIAGQQTALVVGPKGEEIYCDKYGRVRVRFHWEREGDKRDKPLTPDENCTCWIRVANQIAGKKWGFMAIPRIGQEVVVSFLEGDPDRPLIVGSVYNNEQMPHYDLPDHQAKTYIKTNSTKGGEGFNELMFDDAAGKERVFLHAQNDKDMHVLNDFREHIHGDKHRIIGNEESDTKGNLLELLHGSKELTIKKHQLEHIHGSYALNVGNGEAEDPGIWDVVVEKKERKKIGPEGKHLQVEGDSNTSVGGKYSLSVDGEHHESCAGYALEAGGMGNVYIKGGMNVVVEAGMQLTLKVGGSFVAISNMGVDIVGPLVNINSGGSAGSGTAPSPTAPEEAPEALPTEPDEAWNSKTGYKSAKD